MALEIQGLLNVRDTSTLDDLDITNQGPEFEQPANFNDLHSHRVF